MSHLTMKRKRTRSIKIPGSSTRSRGPYPTCANCDKTFKRKSKGYKRRSVDLTLPCGKVARELLTEVTGASFAATADARPLNGQFLCPDCWTLASRIGGYMDSLLNFRTKSSPSSYIGTRSASFRHYYATLPTATVTKEEVEDHNYSVSYNEETDLDDLAERPPKKMKRAEAEPTSSKKVQTLVKW